MVFKLTYPQHIVIRGQCVYYCHDNSHGVALTHAQFLNLNDILNSSLKFMSYPLGGAACLMHYNGEMRLQTKTGFFTFYHKSWRVYKSSVHKRIQFILRHGGRARGEQNACHEVWRRHQPRRPTPTARWQASHWSSRNARGTNFRRKKHASLPQGNHSNPWKCERRSRQRHVSRIRASDSPASSSDDNLQSGDECAIEEEAMSI